MLLDTELIGYKFTAKELADREQLPRTVWPETGRNSVVRNRRRAPRNRNRIPQPWPNRKGMTQPKLTVVKTYEPGHQNRLRAKARLKAEFLMETRRQALEAKTTKQEARR